MQSSLLVCMHHSRNPKAVEVEGQSKESAISAFLSATTSVLEAMKPNVSGAVLSEIDIEEVKKLRLASVGSEDLGIPLWLLPDGRLIAFKSGDSDFKPTHEEMASRILLQTDPECLLSPEFKTFVGVFFSKGCAKVRISKGKVSVDVTEALSVDAIKAVGELFEHFPNRSMTVSQKPATEPDSSKTIGTAADRQAFFSLMYVKEQTLLPDVDQIDDARLAGAAAYTTRRDQPTTGSFYKRNGD